MKRFKLLLKKASNKVLELSSGHLFYFRISMIILGVIFAILILEIYARITYVKFYIPLDCYQSDNLLNHSHVPSKSCPFVTNEWNITYNINSFGFRDKERSLEKPANTFRVLMLGDSFTEGWGVAQDKTFSALLESKLNESGKRNFEVLNMGVASYSPIIEYIQLKDIGLKFNPDLVILNFDYTDFADESAYEAQASFDDKGDPVAVRGILPEYYQQVVGRLQEINDANILMSDQDNKKPVVSFLVNHFYVFRKVFKVNLENEVDKKLQEPTAQDFVLPEKNVLLISRLLKAKNIPFVLTLYPHKSNLMQKDNPKYFSTLQQFGEANGITVLNLLPVFETMKPSDLYFKYDIHGTEKFHQVMAEGIYDYLMENHLVN